MWVGLGPLLVLLHGLGATAEVVAGVEQILTDGLPAGVWLSTYLGIARSASNPPYTFARHAHVVRQLLPRDRDVVVLPHSTGGVVARTLADGSPPVPTAVEGFGLKVDWPEEHVAGTVGLTARIDS